MSETTGDISVLCVGETVRRSVTETATPPAGPVLAAETPAEARDALERVRVDLVTVTVEAASPELFAVLPGGGGRPLVVVGDEPLDETLAHLSLDGHENGDPEVDGGDVQGRRFEALAGETVRLQGLTEREEVLQWAADSFRGVLGLETTVCWLRSGEGSRLEPVVATDSVTQPPLAPDHHALGDGRTPLVVTDGCPIEGVERCLCYPLGDGGLIAVGVTDGRQVRETAVECGRVLVANADAALSRTERLSALRDSEDELVGQNERLEGFASVVSHDLRNPLSVASGCLVLARETGDETHFDGAERALSRMETLIDDLLRLAREGATVDDPTRVSLSEAARRGWSTVDTGDAVLRVEGDREVLADPSRLQQLFENLFRNSVEHSSTSSRSGAGDNVEHSSTSSQRPVSADDSVEHSSTGHRASPDDSVEDGSADDPSPVTVTVTAYSDGFAVGDDGPGIPEALRETVLQPGFSTRPGGSGFGLAIVREIAEAHGWSVAVLEDDTGGARFEFRPR